MQFDLYDVSAEIREYLGRPWPRQPPRQVQHPDRIQRPGAHAMVPMSRIVILSENRIRSSPGYLLSPVVDDR
jgi:hypothetical protein